MNLGTVESTANWPRPASTLSTSSTWTEEDHGEIKLRTSPYCLANSKGFDENYLVKSTRFGCRSALNLYESRSEHSASPSCLS